MAKKRDPELEELFEYIYQLNLNEIQRDFVDSLNAFFKKTGFLSFRQIEALNSLLRYIEAVGDLRNTVNSLNHGKLNDLPKL